MEGGRVFFFFVHSNAHHSPPLPTNSYTALGVAAHGDPVAIAARAEAQKGRVHAGKTAMKTALRANVNRNLPRNVPY